MEKKVSQIISTSFTRHNLNEAEVVQGLSLNSLQYAVIQNRIADIAEELIRLPFTPNDIQSYLQRQAELRGQLDILQSILISSDEVSHSINLNIDGD